MLNSSWSFCMALFIDFGQNRNEQALNYEEMFYTHTQLLYINYIMSNLSNRKISHDITFVGIKSLSQN